MPHLPCTGALRANSPRDVHHGPHRRGAPQTATNTATWYPARSAEMALSATPTSVAIPAKTSCRRPSTANPINERRSLPGIVCCVADFDCLGRCGVISGNTSAARRGKGALASKTGISSKAQISVNLRAFGPQLRRNAARLNGASGSSRRCFRSESYSE